MKSLGRSQKQGMVLVTVMFFVFMIAMVSQIILSNGPGRARLASQGNEELQARKAAEAGAAYARCQLRANADWKGDNNALTVDQEDLKVMEDNGNVIGWLKGSTGQVSMFRIRFNYQDGDAGGDSLPDPSDEHRIDSKYLSLNNVRQFDGVPVPDVDDDFEVSDPDAGTLEAPGGSAFVRVEGLAGTSLTGITDPGGAPAAGSLSSRTLRVVYAASLEATRSDAALSAGGGLQANTGELEITTHGSEVSKIRSKENVEVRNLGHGAGDLTMDGEVAYDRSQTLVGDLSADVVEVDEELGSGGARDFVNVTWEDVPVASASEDEAIQLPGGVYVAGGDGNFRYYDMTVEEYRTAKAANDLGSHEVLLSDDFVEARGASNVASVGGLSISRTETNIPTVEITRDLHVNSSDNGHQDILFTTVSGRSLNGGITGMWDPYMFPGGSDVDTEGISGSASVHVQDSIISGDGDVAIMLNVQGDNAAVTSGGMAALSAPSIALREGEESEETTQHLSVYAQGDVVITTFYEDFVGVDPHGLPLTFRGYGPLNLEGVLYSWGDTRLIAGTPEGMEPPTIRSMMMMSDPWFYDPYADPYGYDPYEMLERSRPNDIDIKGGIVAYGGDPTLFDPANLATGPGTGDSGSIFMAADSVNIEYDSTRLIGDPEALGSELSAVTRVSYGFEN